MPEQTVGRYDLRDVRAPRADAVEPLTFEIAATMSVPGHLLDLARADAVAAGYAEGWAQGIREARSQSEAGLLADRQRADALDAQRRVAVAAGLAALDRAAAALEAQAAPTAAEIEDAVLAAAYAIAESLLQRELRASGLGQDALARVLALAPDNEAVHVRLSPQDHASLELDAPGAGRRMITVEADPALSPGDAVATCGATVIDGRLAEGLARVREVLAR